MAFLDITLSDIAAGVLQDRAAERQSEITLQNVQQQNKTSSAARKSKCQCWRASKRFAGEWHGKHE